MNQRLKAVLFKFLPSTIIILSITIATFISYICIYKSAEEECWSRLENAADVVVTEIKTQFNDDIGVLKLIAQTMANDEELQSHKDFLNRVKSFQTISLFERIDIEYEDSTLVLQDGSIVTPVHTFTELVENGEHMSNPSQDPFSNSRCIYYYVPIQKNNSPIAYLIGVINCNSLSSYFKTKIYNGNTHNFIVDTNNSTLVMSERNKSDRTYNIMQNYTLDSDYKGEDINKNISNLKKGTAKYFNKSGHFYMHYCPIGIFNWELLIVVREDVAFHSLIDMQKSYIFLIIFIILLLAIYFGYNIYRIRKIRKKEKESEKEKEEIAHQLDISNTLIACVKELSSNANIHTSINNLLEIINTYFDAERSYILEINKGEDVDTIFEYRVKDSSIYNVETQKQDLQSIDFTPILSIPKEIIYFKNILNEIPKEAQIYSTLANQNIQDLMIVPFKENNQVYAILGIDNPNKNTEDLDFVYSIKYFIGESLKREKETILLEKLSYQDVLTHTFNRNKYNEFVESHATDTLHNIGVAFFDLNGLKQVNDKYGHLAGDTLIQITASIFQQVFAQCTYRIGGDEFVVIEQNISKEDFDTKLKQVQDRMTLNEISISKGALWKEECKNIFELLQQADQIMYKNKTNFYSQSQNDRRRR